MHLGFHKIFCGIYTMKWKKFRVKTKVHKNIDCFFESNFTPLHCLTLFDFPNLVHDRWDLNLTSNCPQCGQKKFWILKWILFILFNEVFSKVKYDWKLYGKFIKPSLYRILAGTPKIICLHCGLNRLKQKEAKESKFSIVYFNNLPQCNAYVCISASKIMQFLHLLIFDRKFSITIS